MAKIRRKGFRVDWDSDAIQAEFDKRLPQALGKATALLAGEAKKLIGRQGPRGRAGSKTRLKTGDLVRGGKKKAERVRASRPGEPPRKRRGTLQSSVRNERVDSKGLVWRFGTHLKYGFWLEFGTRRGLAPRPWLRPTLRRNAKRVVSVVVSEMKRA